MDVPMAEMFVDDGIRKAVMDVLDSGYWIKGPQARAFEQEFADYCDVSQGIVTSSGTTALVLAFQVAGVGPGTEVIVPSHTFMATVSPLLQLGATPKFVDIDPTTFNLDPTLTREAVSEKTRAIVPVHLYGQPADMKEFRAIADDAGAVLIEDACQSHGATYDGKPTGGLGDLSVFSFFPSKNMTVAGDGGIVLTNNDEMGDRVRRLRDHGRLDKFTHGELGHNFRLSEIQAAVGRQQLKHLPAWVEGRRQHAEVYDRAFAHLTELGVVTPTTAPGREHAWHQYVIRYPHRDALREFCKSRGVSTGIHYLLPVHQQPFVQEQYPVSLPETEKAVGEICSLPIYPQMTPEQQNFVVECISEFVEQQEDLQPPAAALGS